MDIVTLTAMINEAAVSYKVGTLQDFRRMLGRNPRTKKIFTKSTIFAHGEDIYAFHDGARRHRELQFNIGLEMQGQERCWRHGIAFSFEKSRSLLDPEELSPKVRRFNIWVRSYADALRGFQMWDWVGKKPNSKRCNVRQPGEILADSIETEAFVFLGARTPERVVDQHRILQDFDRLYPLYQFVESIPDVTDQSVSSPPVERRGSTAVFTTASRLAGEINVDLRHNLLQQSLVQILKVEFPGCALDSEYLVAEGGRVDVRVDTNEGSIFCEIKVAPHVRAALREAIGQLLEYTHWPKECRAKKWWVVSEGVPSVEDIAYLQDLRGRYALPVFYRRIDPEATVLGPES